MLVFFLRFGLQILTCLTLLARFFIDEGNVFEASPENRRQLGVFSATLLIFNRVIGTGIFATPGTILSLSGSVGLSLFMWVIGTFIAMAGTAVYMEWGTAIPKYVLQNISQERCYSD